MPLLHCATRSAGCADASFRSGTFHLGDRRGTAPRARRRAELAPLAEIPAGACFQSTRRTARPPRPLQGRRQTANNRSGYDARIGSATRTCASVPSLIDSQTAAATKPDSGISIRCTPLRSTATPDLETTNTLARAPAVSLRSVPQLEAAGDRQANKRRSLRSPASRVVSKRTDETATPQISTRSVRRDGMKDRSSATMLVPARLGTWPCSALSNTRAVMSSCLPIAGTRWRRTPGNGSPPPPACPAFPSGGPVHET